MDFRGHIRDNTLSSNDRILEFGPLNRPIATKDKFPNVVYADIRNTKDIKKLYKSNDFIKSTGVVVDVDSIIDIDFVIKDSYKNTFKDAEKFDVIILSHVVEHMPDIIGFFTDIEAILKDNGKLIIIYPDVRYCFDHFRNGTKFIDAYDVYRKKTSSAACVFDFAFNVVKENDPSFFWEGLNTINILPANSFDSSISKYNKVNLGETPDDVHYWPFSDYQFIKFLYDMDRASLLGFAIDKFYETLQDTQEFMVILSKKNHEKVKKMSYQNILKNLSASKEVSGLRQINRELRSEVDLLTSEKLELSRKNNNLMKMLESVHKSNSWRVTRPIRRLTSSIRQIMKRINL